MSLREDTIPQKMAVRLRAGTVSFAMRRMVRPFIDQMSAARSARDLKEMRKATRREIANLPAGLQQDLAFDDGTVLGLDYS